MTRLLHGYAERQASRRPEAPAIVMGAETLSFGDVADRSDRIARMLIETGCQAGDRICFLMAKSPLAVLTMLGILKAGCVYVPLDAVSPPARLARVIRAAAPRFILAAGSVKEVLDGTLAILDEAEQPRIGVLEADWTTTTSHPPSFVLGDIESLPGELTPVHRGPSDAAHILFTSGSTGQPKGVVITHANVTSFVDWAVGYFGMRSTDRVSGHSPLHFDLSTFDVFGALAAGATLYPVPPQLNLTATRLVDFIRTSRLTQWFSVPSVLSYVASFDAVPKGAFPELGRLMWCGEVFPTPQLDYWMERLPQTSFTNLYGPTEATIASSYHTVPARPTNVTESVPIGVACGGEELLLLDAGRDYTVKVGEVGRLFIGGDGLSPGYWRDAESTARAFGPHPEDPSRRIYDTGDLASIDADGLVHFRGRADTQIKSRGYRIELGEIETALHAIEELREGAIVAIRSTGFEGYVICCAYVVREDCDVTPAALRRQLSATIPGYMLPSRYRAMTGLTKNANGKIDRPALREAFRTDA